MNKKDVRIFATFGPSCKDEAVLRSMITEGMDGMRLNLSHMTLPMAQEYISAYRGAAAALGKEPCLLIDMQGPELRVERADIMLTEGEIVVLGEGGIILPPAVLEELNAGDELLLDDGKILCRIKDSGSALVVRGGFLKSRKSVKIKDKNVDMPVLTEHDIANIRLAGKYGVNAIMQPFVRLANDLIKVRQILDQNGACDLKIYAKIENRRGIEALCDILPHADVIVIARGDLGNDMPLWELPAVQKYIESICHEHNKPYIVVTQMLASMENSPVPTRAEVSDIFHAVYHGAWGVMITGETAVGKYPAEAVRYLSKTAKSVREKSILK